MTVAPPPPMSVMHHALAVNYNVPPPAVPLASTATQLSYVTVAHTLSSPAAPANVVCYVYCTLIGQVEQQHRAGSASHCE